MKLIIILSVAISSLIGLSSFRLHSEESTGSFYANFQLMDVAAFHKIIVGNTVIGTTHQSQSLYMLYFAPDGSCELWKQNKVYVGNWWIDKDKLGRDLVHAMWVGYQSSDPRSLFSPENPHYGKPTSILYYFAPEQPNSLILATKSYRTAATLAPGRQLGS